MRFYCTTCKNTNIVNVALEKFAQHSGSLGSWASGALLPPHDTLRKTARMLLIARCLGEGSSAALGAYFPDLATPFSSRPAPIADVARAVPPFSGVGGSPMTIWNEKVAGTSASA